MLGSLNVVFFARFKHAHQVVEQAAGELKTQSQTISRLQEENKF